MSIGQLLALEGVRTAPLSQTVSLMRRGRPHPPHLDPTDLMPPHRQLPRRLTRREAAANNSSPSHTKDVLPQVQLSLELAFTVRAAEELALFPGPLLDEEWVFAIWAFSSDGFIPSRPVTLRVSGASPECSSSAGPLFGDISLFTSGAFESWYSQGLGIPALWVVATSDEAAMRSEEHTSELQSRGHLVCRLLL